MILDVSLLRRASVANLERLARSVDMPLPRRVKDARVYHQRLVEALASLIRREAMMQELRRLAALPRAGAQ